MDTKIDIVTALAKIPAPSFFFPSPNFNDKLAAAPFPINPATALKIITSGKMTFVAAFPSVPTPCPINI